VAAPFAPTIAEAHAIPEAVAAGVPVAPVAAAVPDFVEPACAAITETTVAMHAIPASITGISESRCGTAGEQQSTCNNRGSQKALHGSISSVVLSGPG
jgi:hypothetical protein